KVADSNKVREEKEKQITDNKNKSDATQKTIITQTVAIGDSVMLDIEPYLKEAVPNITIDGLVGRQLRDAITTATGYKKFNNENNSVISVFGT
ncbi:acetyltransferase, partial [Escherichia coli]|nr:acetyltransferase [Escherichia coli]